MHRLFVLILIFPLSLFGQVKSLTKAELTKAYILAIEDFIKVANTRYKVDLRQPGFDTLFIGKRRNGQEDDFPDIELPAKVDFVQVRLVTPELGKKLQQQRKSRIYLNMMGWVEKEKAEFLFYVFSNGFEHQYNYTLNYKYSTKLGRLELVDVQFKGPPFDK